MKKNYALILVLLLITAILFAACDPTSIVPNGSSDSTPAGADGAADGASGDSDGGLSDGAGGGAIGGGASDGGAGDGGAGDGGAGDGGAGDPPASTLYTREGDAIFFGSYPQTKMTDETLVAALNGLLA